MRLRKADIRRLFFYAVIVLFLGLNIPGFFIPALKFKTWTAPVFWTFGMVLYKISEQMGESFNDQEGVPSHLKLFYALYFGVAGITLLPIVEFTFFQRNNLIVSSAGFLFLVAGGYFRFIALKTLGDFYSNHIKIYEKHQLINVGIYRRIRHPGYLGAFCLGAGSLLAANAWFSGLFFVFYFIPVLALRIHHEEHRLRQALSGYREYCSKTKRFIPYII